MRQGWGRCGLELHRERDLGRAVGQACCLRWDRGVALKSDLTLARRDTSAQGGRVCVQGHVLLLWDLTAQTSV